ncbi:hypothetical protein NX722_06680 [Endozoicomonas gorgoniicola]|uniref:Uncharacterized protein n=1 Tax=Endozoicomonas gorgoniicola TaxID=1234144 RepID=A0ABT3MSH9_9GAMM|nr:hypothetical protein [Endozoicomonas gorgoniicola]MCW7552336.1 hypothetical protein [Endozoicomonas gorgoniicola]
MKALCYESSTSKKIINKLSHSFKKPLVIAITSATLCSLADWSYSAPAIQSPASSMISATITASYTPASGSLVIGDNHYAYTTQKEPDKGEKSIQLQSYTNIATTPTLHLKRLKSVSSPILSKTLYLMTSGSTRSIISVTKTKGVMPASSHLYKSGFNAQSTNFQMTFTKSIQPSGSSTWKTSLPNGTLISITNHLSNSNLSLPDKIKKIIERFTKESGELKEQITKLGNEVRDMVHSKKTIALLGGGIIITGLCTLAACLTKCINFEHFYDEYQNMNRVIKKGQEIQKKQNEEKNSDNSQDDLQKKPETSERQHLTNKIVGQASGTTVALMSSMPKGSIALLPMISETASEDEAEDEPEAKLESEPEVPATHTETNEHDTADEDDLNAVIAFFDNIAESLQRPEEVRRRSGLLDNIVESLPGFGDEESSNLLENSGNSEESDFTNPDKTEDSGLLETAF